MGPKADFAAALRDVCPLPHELTSSALRQQAQRSIGLRLHKLRARLIILKMIGQTPPLKQLASSIRVAEPCDVSEIRRIARAAYAKYVPRIGREPAPMSADYDADVAACRAVVIESEGKPCGYMVSWPEADVYFIENIGVEPGYQGSGLGRRLIEHAVAQAKCAGLSALSLYTNEAMTENLAMYAHIGFLETHRLREHGFRRVYMRWAF